MLIIEQKLDLPLFIKRQTSQWNYGLFQEEGIRMTFIIGFVLESADLGGGLK